jgi:hypothetical protein
LNSSRGFAEALSPRLVACHTREGGRESLRLGWRNKFTDLRCDELAGSADIGCDNRTTRRHRLEKGKRHSFMCAREARNIGG